MLNSEFPMPIRGSRSYELVGPRIGIGNSELSIGQISVLPCPTFGISASDAPAADPLPRNPVLGDRLAP